MFGEQPLALPKSAYNFHTNKKIAQNCDKTEIVTELKELQNSKSDKTHIKKKSH